MKNIKYILFAFLIITGCSDDDDQTLPSVTAQYQNLHAPQAGGQGQPISGPFTKFDFASGEVTNDDNDWDIAFRGTTILVNGGSATGLAEEPARSGQGAAAIADGTFASVVSTGALTFSQDSNSGPAITPGSGNGWYNYAGAPTYLISPIPGKILVIRTRDGALAKLEILSYYKDAPSMPNAFSDQSQYYTFNYLYNPNKNSSSLE